MYYAQSIKFDNFIIQAGTDASLVPTDMATTNATVKFTYRNKGTFFGIHVTADPFQLAYSQLTLANGDVRCWISLLLISAIEITPSISFHFTSRSHL
jgi:hypothetical protein